LSHDIALLALDASARLSYGRFLVNKEAYYACAYVPSLPTYAFDKRSVFL